MVVILTPIVLMVVGNPRGDVFFGGDITTAQKLWHVW